MTTAPHTTPRVTHRTTSPTARRTAHRLAGTGLLALGAVAGAVAGTGSAGADGNTPASPQAATFRNDDGTVECEVLPDSGTATCIVTSPQAREKMPECAPPGRLEPSLTVTPDEGRVECRNQGLMAEPELLPAGQERSVGDYSVTASDDGSLTLFDGEGLRAVAAPDRLEARAPLALQDAPGGVTVR